MEIEDLIDQQSRLQQGIFFTKHHIVNFIVSDFTFNNVNNVLDSAAGSCNFLITLAKKYPHINFYGVEKNTTIYKQVSKEIKNIKNLKYYNGDILLDDFPIPECDLYLGNPPFINYSDLDNDYRTKIRPIWMKHFPDSKGFKMLLGDSRGDIAQLIFNHTIDRYLKDGGEIGVILPDSLIKGNSASSGFREFTGIKVNKLVDLSEKEAFDNTQRNCFYIKATKGDSTTYPLKYYCKDRIRNLVKRGDDLVEEGNSLLKKSTYIARQGVNTLGANSIFFFKSQPPFKSSLIKPLLKSSDINCFSYKASYHILFPYTEGKLIDESILKSKHPKVYNYLTENKAVLKERKSRFAQKCWYSLFGVGKYTFNKYKVIWRGLGARELMAAVTVDVIPNQAMNCYISTNCRSEAHYVCGIMNSEIYKEQLNLLNEKGAKSFAQPSTINKIYIPGYDSRKRTHSKIAEVSEKLHKSLCPKTYTDLNLLVIELFKSEGFNLAT